MKRLWPRDSWVLKFVPTVYSVDRISVSCLYLCKVKNHAERVTLRGVVKLSLLQDG